MIWLDGEEDIPRMMVKPFSFFNVGNGLEWKGYLKPGWTALQTRLNQPGFTKGLLLLTFTSWLHSSHTAKCQLIGQGEGRRNWIGWWWWSKLRHCIRSVAGIRDFWSDRSAMCPNHGRRQRFKKTLWDEALVSRLATVKGWKLNASDRTKRTRSVKHLRVTCIDTYPGTMKPKLSVFRRLFHWINNRHKWKRRTHAMSREIFWREVYARYYQKSASQCF